MIPRDYITEWRSQIPWVDDAQVEQDLVISRALVEIFSNATLYNALAFRGGTALYKLHMPAARYSEDIDLVQVRSEPAGLIMDSLHHVLDSWLGKPRFKQTWGRITYKYIFQSVDGNPLRLKVEINTREHQVVQGSKQIPFEVNSRWFNGSCSIRSYELNELLGKKLRALYQRRKGRDLFDLAVALESDEADPEKIIDAFNHYMRHGGHKVTRKQFEENMTLKSKDKNFASDIGPLLAEGYEWNLESMTEKVNDSLISLLPS